mmetsp:Transcript_8392/g.15537  ORF Transcript_8392/g.15537 Transcript_8392/m.15537 type:complete len:237 (-) Transcript_8392:255-965(-)
MPTHTPIQSNRIQPLSYCDCLCWRCGGCRVLVLEETCHHVLVLEEEDTSPTIGEVVDGNEPVSQELDEGRDVLHHEETHDGRQVNLTHQGRNHVAEDVQVRVRDLPERQPRVLVPVDVWKPSQKHPHKQDERVERQEVCQRFAQQDEGVHGSRWGRVVHAKLAREGPHGRHHAEVSHLLLRRRLRESQLACDQGADAPYLSQVHLKETSQRHYLLVYLLPRRLGAALGRGWSWSWS